MFVKQHQFFENFISFVKIMSPDFSKIKKEKVGQLCRKKKRIFVQNFRKIAG